MKQQRITSVLLVPFVLAAAAACLACGAAAAAELSDNALVEELRSGGYVIVMRHASAEREAPAPQQAVPANIHAERQLDEDGRAAMTAMRSAFRRLGIPVGDVLSSPAFRARETAEYLGHGFSRLQIAEQLGGEEADAEWLRQQAAESPVEGKNTVIISHGRNLGEAFGEDASDLQEAEALIYRPEGGNPTRVARLQVEQWVALGRD